MYRIDNATAQVSLPSPRAVGPNPNGYFYRGDPSLATLATIVDDDWLNSMQEEFCRTVEAAGITLDKTSYVQLKLAIDYFAQRNGAVFASSSSAANTYVATLTPAPAAYTTGMWAVVSFTHTNTSSATINLNTLGAKTMVRPDGTNLQSGDIKDGMIGVLFYDGTNFQLINAQMVNAIYWQNNPFTYCVDSGSANSITAALSPAPTSYTAGLSVFVKIAANNTGATTINVNGLGSKNVKTMDIAALPANALVAGMIAELHYDGTQFQLKNPMRFKSRGLQEILSSTTYTVPAGVYSINVKAWGTGASGGGSVDGAVTGGGGGAGAYAEDWIDVTPGQTFTVTIPSAPAGAAINSAADGVDGGNVSFGSSVIAAGGKAGIHSTGTGGSATGGAGGLGGAIADCTGSVKMAGQKGYRTSANSALISGKGGSSPGNTPAYEGNNNGTSFSGLPNTAQGGQGGSSNSAAGDGATGKVVVSW